MQHVCLDLGMHNPCHPLQLNTPTTGLDANVTSFGIVLAMHEEPPGFSSIVAAEDSGPLVWTGTSACPERASSRHLRISTQLLPFMQALGRSRMLHIQLLRVALRSL